VLWADRTTMVRIAGMLYLCGAFLNLLALRLPHPAEMQEPGLYGVMSGAVITGLVFIRWADRIPMWTLHAAIGLGAWLVSACIYFSGETASVYATMLVWVAVVAACYFPGRAAYVHLAWLLVGYGIAIAALGEAPGFSPLTWWLLTAFALSVVSVATSWLMGTARQASDALEAEIDERTRLQHELEYLAHHDALTGLANRRRFQLELEREMARAARRSDPLCVGALDLDGFKALNDRLGHAGGDRVLKAAASSWNSSVRALDLIARFGGDEFVVLLPDCPPAEAERVLGRLARALPDDQTCSTGVACWDGEESAGELLSRADAAMYAAKRRGREGAAS
jgi:diguanylate cyclase (GGDEF)-like protein